MAGRVGARHVPRMTPKVVGCVNRQMEVAFSHLGISRGPAAQGESLSWSLRLVGRNRAWEEEGLGAQNKEKDNPLLIRKMHE